MLSSIPIPWGFSPRDGSVTYSCPCLPLFLRASHPVNPMPGPFINCMEIQMSPCHPQDVPLSRTFRQMLTSASSSTRLEQICVFPSLLSWEKTCFHHVCKGGFPSNPLHSNPWSVPLCPFPFWIIPYNLGWELLAAGEHIRLFAGPWPCWGLEECSNHSCTGTWRSPSPWQPICPQGLQETWETLTKPKLALSKTKNKLKKSPLQNLPRVNPNVWFNHQANFPRALQAFPF